MHLLDDPSALGRMPHTAAAELPVGSASAEQVFLADDDGHEATAWATERDKLRRRLLGMILRNETLRKAHHLR
jgi:hypothetical protein